MAKRVYITCPVTMVTPDDKAHIEAYVAMLEDDGYIVHYPARDTDQTQEGFNICLENVAAIQEADEVHVFFRSGSKGSHFDLGAAFALDFMITGNKKVFKLIDFKVTDGNLKSATEFHGLLKKWEDLRGL